MDEQLELEADIQQEMAASGDFVEGSHRVRGEAHSSVLRAVTGTWARRRPAAHYHRRRFATPARIFLTLAVALVATFALTPVASADFWTPEDGASPNADDIDTLYKIVFALGVLVFLGVTGVLAYSLVKFRARKGAVPAQIRGNTRLEIGWTVGAALILVVIAVVTFLMLDDIRNAPESTRGPRARRTGPSGENDTANDRSFPPSGKSLRVLVNGQQYVWRYTYPDDTPTTCRQRLLLRGARRAGRHHGDARDQRAGRQPLVVDPKLGGKFDAIPGHTNYTWFQIPGKLAGQTFRGQCAELCGRNHANMYAHVRAVTPDEYEAYIERKRREISDANKAAAEQRREIEGQ